MPSCAVCLSLRTPRVRPGPGNAAPELEGLSAVIAGVLGAIAAGIVGLLASWLIQRASGVRPILAIAIAALAVLTLATLVIAAVVALTRL